jgi:hypothetical protein
MATDQINRRACDRFALRPMLSPVSIQRVRDGRMETISGHACDISESGFRLEIDAPVEIGEHLNISLTLPGHAEGDPSGAVTAACQVVWLTDADDDPAFPRAGVRTLRYLDSNSAARLRASLGRRWLREAA